MADDLEGLLSPSAINPVSRDLPRQDEPPPKRRRQPPARPSTEQEAADEAQTEADQAAATGIGTRLNVRV